MMRRTGYWLTVVLGGVLLTVSSARGAEEPAEKYLFSSERRSGTLDRIEAALEVSGNAQVLDESTEGADLGEDEAMRIATEEVTRVRRRRRSSRTVR